MIMIMIIIMIIIIIMIMIIIINEKSEGNYHRKRLQAEVHGTIFASDHLVQLFLLALFASRKNRMASFVFCESVVKLS